ncbi:MAG: hypothetical protein ACW99Q_22615 [Candidatus Kariarchaeaceae archaeon]
MNDSRLTKVYTLDKIKKIIENEIKSKFNAMRQFPEITLYSDSLLDRCEEDVIDNLLDSDDYDKLDNFVGKYYRMSLSEWLESL